MKRPPRVSNGVSDSPERGRRALREYGAGSHVGEERHGEGGHLQVMVAGRRAAAAVRGPAAAVAASAAVAAGRGGELIAGGVDVG